MSSFISTVESLHCYFAIDEFYQASFYPSNPLQPTDPLFFTSADAPISPVNPTTNTSSSLPGFNPLAQRTAVMADRQPVPTGVYSSPQPTQSTPRPEEPSQTYEGATSDTSRGTYPQKCKA